MEVVRRTVAAVVVCLGTFSCSAGDDGRRAEASRAPTASPETGVGTATDSAPKACGRCFGERGSLVGTDGDDRLRGTPGEDFIVAGDGDDVIERIREDDHVCAGPGDDVVLDVDGGGIGLSLGRGDDTAVVRNVLFVWASEGDDRCVVTGRWAQFHGGPGDDVMEVPGAPKGGPFDERPTASYSGATRRVKVDLTTGRVTGQGADTLTGVVSVEGTRYRDVFLGSGRGEYFDTRGGRNLVRAGGGDNQVYADHGDDVVELGGGADTAWLAGGDDRASGGPGSDYLMGESGDDDMTGEGGDDRLSGDVGDDSLAGGPGFDAVTEEKYLGDPSGFGDDRLRSIERWTTRILRD